MGLNTGRWASTRYASGPAPRRIEDGEMVEKFNDSELKQGTQIKYYHLMRDIYSVAGRQALGGDTVLDKILLAMEKTFPLS